MLEANKADWTAMLALMQTVQKEITIKTDGITAQCITIDPAKVMFVKTNMNCDGDEGTFSVNSEQFLKAIAAVGGDSPKVSVDRDKGSIQIIGDSKIRVPLLVDPETVDIFKNPNFQSFDIDGKITKEVLEPLVNYSIKKQDHLTFQAENDVLKVQIGEGADVSECEFKGVNGMGCASYPLDYIASLLKNARGEIRVQFNTDSPIFMQWTAAHSLCVNAVVAPRIETD